MTEDLIWSQKQRERAIHSHQNTRISATFLSSFSRVRHSNSRHNSYSYTMLLLLITSLICLVSIQIGTISAAPKTPQNAPYNTNQETNPDATLYKGSWPNHRYMPSPDDWRQIPIYQFVTDRFRDGNPQNNEQWGLGGYNLYKVDTRHGGDFEGVRQKLDYIKNLGFKAIWLSPVFLNGFNSYHGYAQEDFTVLDPRFGTVDDFRALTDAAHSRGMYVIVDIVVNHMANLLYFEGHEKDSAPFRMHHDEYRLFYRNETKQYVDFVVNNTFVPSGRYPVQYGSDGEAHEDSTPGAEGSYWNSDFHHNGDLSDYGNPFENDLGKIYGIMDDLRTESPRVQKKIIAMTNSLISSVDVDGIRMDTPMQVSREFFDAWTPAVKHHAATLGKGNFFIFGEMYCSKERAATMTGRGKTPSMYGRDQFISKYPNFDAGINYPQYWWMQQSVRDQKGQVNGILTSYMDDWNRYDLYSAERRENRYRFLNFFNNHDQWRVAASEDGLEKSKLATAIIALFPGIPLYYYGDEQGFYTHGTALDGESREDMQTSLAWRSLAPPGFTENPSNHDSFNQTNEHYLWTQLLMNIRRNYPAVNSCDKVDEKWVQHQADNGLLIVMRSCGSDSEKWLLVAINTSKQKQSTEGTFVTGWDSGRIMRNLLSVQRTEEYQLQSEGRVQLSLEPYEAKVFALIEGVQPLDPVVRSISPVHDSVWNNKTEFVYTIEFDQEMDEDSLRRALSFTGCFYRVVSWKWKWSLILTVGVQVNEGGGLLHMRISEEARTKDGARTFHGAFEHRIRIGSEDNIIVYPVGEKALRDDSLVIHDESTGDYKIYHKANGAAMYRIQMETEADFGPWKDIPSNRVSTLSGVHYSVGSPVTVQYWGDGSAAYFVKCVIQN